MSMPSHPMQIGVPLDELSLLFFGCLFVAIWLVYIFCKQKFAERSVIGSSEWIYQLLPRQLATRKEYSKGFLTYFGTMAAAVAVLSLLGPKNLAALGIALPKEVGYIAVPLFIAFVLIGALPTVPGLMAIEKHLRAYAHRRAYIPDAARATAERLAAADFDFSSYQGDALQSPEMRGVDPADFTRSRRSLCHSWARLCCLVFVQKSCRMNSLTDSLDASLLRDYETDLELIESQKKSMEAEVAAYRAAKASDPYYANDDLHRAIRDNLYKLYILLGCAVRLKTQPHDDIDLALRRFGFDLKLNHTKREQYGDLQLVGLTAVTASVALLGLAAWGIGRLALWEMSPIFPQKVFQPFVDAASVLALNATAILFADWMRKHLINNGSWSRASGSHRGTNIANYIRVALVSGVAGYLGLVLWGFTQQTPTWNGFIIDAPFALLAMVTGGFYAYHLDNAEIGHRPSRWRELGWQAGLTGICGLIAACAAGEYVFGGAGAVIDKIILATIINSAVGFVFAWYIPQAAADARRDPLTEACEERGCALETAALVRLGSAGAASWLDTVHPALGDKSPRAASAASAEGFENAIALLQRPRALTA